MIRISEVIVVEGKYDRATLQRFVDAEIVETGGFRLFKDKELLRSLRFLAEKRGLIILTDSDSAGFLIRDRLTGSIDGKYIKNAYIPGIGGKERRKREPSKEGLLGVEGMDEKNILNALLTAGATVEDGENVTKRSGINKMTLYDLGLSGKQDSAEKRKVLAERLSLPPHLSADRLARLLDVTIEKDELEKICKEVFEKWDTN